MQNLVSPMDIQYYIFHGGASCRLEPLLWGDETIRRLGLRLIAPDRPGIGQSDFQPNRGFSDWGKRHRVSLRCFGFR